MLDVPRSMHAETNVQSQPPVKVLSWAGSAQALFDCVVIDPPWENASAKRAAQYSTLPSRYLLSVPLHKLLNPVRPPDCDTHSVLDT